jgi:hypothetical protein
LLFPPKLNRDAGSHGLRLAVRQNLSDQIFGRLVFHPLEPQINIVAFGLKKHLPSRVRLAGGSLFSHESELIGHRAVKD